MDARHSMPIVTGMPTICAASRNSRAPEIESWSMMPAVQSPSIRAANTAAVGEYGEKE
jgi:hypothetical protein